MERNNTDMRVDVRVRLEHVSAPSAIKQTGRVWVDTTFDDCKLQSTLVYSGDPETAKALYQGRLRITADSTLTLVAT